MTRNKPSYFLFIYLCISSACFSQTVEKIKIRKDHKTLYFFQKGKASDTISPGLHDLFYINVSDTLKNDITFWIENAQLQSHSADTLLKIKYIPGLRYEAYYARKDSAGTKYHWSNFVNGAATIEKNKIRIQIFDRKDHELLLENNFVFKP